ncbi:unnamed protein product [Ostreobium quekettii]|uniref:Alpha/beta hydrolase n=1 Tax=Ostreobium quekettii TaxID=121088 RepID=A0A8S1JFD5_9CHLO|nr:unnamed protein product [Ostreobium quekettii]|eukprot:evm.model.scf_872.4 EVM.evm.TU.scf_872.4   scf_872:47256-50447(-)
MAWKNEEGKVLFKSILTKQSMDKRMCLDMDAVARRIQRTNVLTIRGSADGENAVAKANKFSAIRLHDVAIIDGADHHFSNLEHGAALVDELVEFLTRGV